MAGLKFPTYKRKEKKIKVNQISAIRKFANSLLVHFRRQECFCDIYKKDCDCIQSMDLDIDTIDGIKLDCTISLEDKYTVLAFVAESRNIFEYCEGEEQKLVYYQYFERSKHFLENPADVYKFCKKLRSLLPKLKLQPNGKLEDGNAPKKELSLTSFLGNTKNIGLKSVGDCSVCYQKTRSFISCKHLLCIRCMFSLRPNEDDDVYCPMCREDITICTNIFVNPRD